MKTLSELEQVDAMAMMLMCELGFARYERFRAGLEMNGETCERLRKFIYECVDREEELEARIRVAPMRKPMP
ncbi:hypothetical protein D3C77_301350 [compost metagenome]